MISDLRQGRRGKKSHLNIELANGLLHLAHQVGEGDQIISSAVCQLVVDLTWYIKIIEHQPAQCNV